MPHPHPHPLIAAGPDRADRALARASDLAGRLRALIATRGHAPDLGGVLTVSLEVLGRMAEPLQVGRKLGYRAARYEVELLEGFTAELEAVLQRAAAA